MKVNTYTDDDLQDRGVHKDESRQWGFITDIPGDNPDLLGDMDNNELQVRLQEFGALPEGATADCETCCSYYYFKDKAAGRKFITKLNQYLLKKAELSETARSF